MTLEQPSNHLAPCRAHCACGCSAEFRRPVTHGAVLVVLERGATWPAPPLTEGHEDVVVLAQQPDRDNPALLRRLQRYVAALRASKRCMRTAVLVAAPSGNGLRQELAQMLRQTLCPCCGRLWLVGEEGDEAMRARLRDLASALGKAVENGANVALADDLVESRV